MLFKRLISAVLSVVVMTSAELFAAQNVELSSVPVSAVSSQDGSLWLGTRGQGLLRLGRNGRAIQYNAAQGQLGSDTVLALAFDQAGILYVLDDSGRLSTYSAVGGFSVPEGFASAVEAVSASSDSKRVYVVCNRTLYAFENGTAAKLAQLPASVKSLLPGQAGTVWAIGEGGSWHYSDGTLTAGATGAVPSDSFMKTIDMELGQPAKPSPEPRRSASESPRRQGSSMSALWLILCLAAGLCAGFLLSRLLPGKKEPSADEQHITPDPILAKVEKKLASRTETQPAPEAVPEVTPEAAPEKAAPELEPDLEPAAAPEVFPELFPELAAKPAPAALGQAPVKAVTQKKVSFAAPNADTAKPGAEQIQQALQQSDFGRKLLELVIRNMANPSYGVEEVAADLGITRIHVNRKLKAETGFSPSAVFKAIRMNEAVRLLREGQFSIAEIAQKCGFSTASYFSTAFKDYFSLSPSDFLS